MDRRRGAVVACLLIAVGWFAPPPAHAADGLIISSSAIYDVRPEEGRAVVTVNLAATNVTPDTATVRTYYDGVSVAIPAAATSVYAASGGVGLSVTLSPADEAAQFASISFSGGVFYQQTYQFTLGFVLPDAGGDPGRETWIRSRFVTLPIYAFGTPGAAGVSVEVVLPAGFRIQIPYGSMEVSETDSDSRASAVGVDPATFGAYLSAERSGERARHEIEIQMDSGPVPVVFLAWPDDTDWSTRQADILTRALPLLGREIGLEYPVERTLRVSEHAYEHLGRYAGFFVAGIDTIEMRFDADAFTALHEAAHIWFNHGIAEDRWLLEGFASYYAEVVGTELGEGLDVNELTDEVREAAFPLTTWGGVGAEDDGHEAYGYAASHELARRIAELAGPEALTAVWQAADDEELAYGTHPGYEGLRRSPNPDGWRRFLDLFENASDADFDDIWREWLLTDSQARELPERDAARDGYRATEAALGEWEMPDSTRRDMEAWDFDDATAELEAVDRLVEDHAAMAERAASMSLEPTDEVGDLLGTGVEEAAAELDRQEAALADLASVTARLANEPELLERIGLLGGDSPEDGLAAARAAFEDGDEAAARERADDARAVADGAADQGRLRVGIAGGGILLLDLLAMAGLGLRRRRRAARRASGLA